MAKRFGLPVDQWLKLLKQERNIDVEQYASDIIWPTLALRRLAGQRLTISRDELEQYFEMTPRREGRRAADFVQRSEGGGEDSGAGGRPSGKVRRPGEAQLGGRQQRQHRRAGPADSPARRLQGDRAGRLLHGRRRGLAGDFRRGAIRDSQARKPAAARQACGWRTSRRSSKRSSARRRCTPWPTRSSTS